MHWAPRREVCQTGLAARPVRRQVRGRRPRLRPTWGHTWGRTPRAQRPARITPLQTATMRTPAPRVRCGRARHCPGEALPSSPVMPGLMSGLVYRPPRPGRCGAYSALSRPHTMPWSGLAGPVAGRAASALTHASCRCRRQERPRVDALQRRGSRRSACSGKGPSRAPLTDLPADPRTHWRRCVPSLASTQRTPALTRASSAPCRSSAASQCLQTPSTALPSVCVRCWAGACSAPLRPPTSGSSKQSSCSMRWSASSRGCGACEGQGVRRLGGDSWHSLRSNGT